MNENVIEWLRGQKTVAVTLCSNGKFNNKLLKLAETHPEIQIRFNDDGSMFTHVPLSWIKISPPRKVSEEQKRIAGERFKKMWEDKRSN